MGFPCTPDSRIRSRNDAAAVAMLLKERHDGHFMVWNLAEEGYDYAMFDGQVSGWLGEWGEVCTAPPPSARAKLAISRRSALPSRRSLSAASPASRCPRWAYC